MVGFMTIQLRDYQLKLKNDIYQSWNDGNKNVLAVLPTGAGKTACVSEIVLDHHNINQKCAVVAHRNELVGQMSCAIALQNIPHRIIGSNSTVAQIVRKHRKQFGKSFVNPSAQTAVVGVDTLMARKDDLKDWARQMDLWVIDESHHNIGNDRVDPNKWGKAVELFTNARGLGVTATPQRADGQGLGWEFDGAFHDMIVGPSMRHLIDQNYLSDYEIVCPESDLQVDDSPVSKDGDWSNKTLRKAAKRSHIVGDVVENYIRYAAGRKAIVFATDVETANEIAKKFNDNDIRAVSLNGKSLPAYREQSLEQFESGEITVLVNVDLFDEGFNVPDAEVCVMARPTTSLGKFLQQTGRVLRPQPNKTALIIDHVSNVIRHGLPDKYREWSLDRRDKRAKQMKDPDEILLTTCKTCRKPYEAFRTACPYCGASKPLPVGGARTVEQVDGDLILLDQETLARMRAATEMESAADVASRVRGAAGTGAGKYQGDKQIEKIAAHGALKETIAIWAGHERARGFTDQEIYRRFYLTLGVDMSGALDASRSRQEFEKMNERVRGWVRS